MIDLLTCGFVFGWLAIGETLGGRYVALDREDRELVVARNAVTRVVAVRDQTDRAGDEEEQRREDRRRATLPPRALARRVRTARLSTCSAAARGCSVTAAFFSVSAPRPSVRAPDARMSVSPGSTLCRHTSGSTSASLPSDAASRVVVRCTKSASSPGSSPGRKSRARRTRKTCAAPMRAA